MTKTFTQNDVIRYFYNEVTTQEKQDIENALLWDNALADYYQELVQMNRSLNKIKKQPSDRTIENILNFSKSFSLHTA
jgi:hypothetical protein